MEALEFIRTLQKLCTGSKCYDCPLEEKGRCIIIHAVNPEESVRIVEEWEAEQESKKPEQERQNPEQEKRMQEIEEKIRILLEKTQMMGEASAMQTKRIDELHEMFEKVRKDMRLVDAILLLFVETESAERAKMEKRLTERI